MHLKQSLTLNVAIEINAIKRNAPQNDTKIFFEIHQLGALPSMINGKNCGKFTQAKQAVLYIYERRKSVFVNL